MIHRRTLLLGTAGLAASSVLFGCSNRTNRGDALRVTLLEGAIPSEIIQSFRKQTDISIDFQLRAQMSAVFQQLQRWQQSPTESESGWRRLLPWQPTEERPAAHNLVSLGDYWLQSAIAQNLIEPLPLNASQLEPLPSQWQQFVSRDVSGRIAFPNSSSPDDSSSSAASETGVSLWAAPYKVQSLVIVYRQRTNSSAFESWSDLLAPTLQGKIALPNHPNLVFGLLQKMQTGRFNAPFGSQTNSSASTTQLVAQLKEQLAAPFRALNQQVKTYDSSTALKALVNEDLQAIVTWSGDVVTALQRYRSLRAVVPEEGSLLSADIWVRPKGVAFGEQAKAWIDFCWQPGPATQLSVSGAGISPIFLRDQGFPDSLAAGRLSEVALQNSEPLLPLPDAMQAAYFELWRQLRSGVA